MHYAVAEGNRILGSRALLNITAVAIRKYHIPVVLQVWSVYLIEIPPIPASIERDIW